MRVSDEFVIREIAGEYIIVPTGKAALNFQGLITVNEVGAFLWTMLQRQDIKQDELIQELCKEYEVSENQAEKDVEEFIDTLSTHNMLI